MSIPVHIVAILLNRCQVWEIQEDGLWKAKIIMQYVLSGVGYRKGLVPTMIQLLIYLTSGPFHSILKESVISPLLK